MGERWATRGTRPTSGVMYLYVPHVTCHMYATVGERWAAREIHPTSGGAMYAATDSKGKLPICAAVIRNPEATSILSFHASHFLELMLIVLQSHL